MSKAFIAAVIWDVHRPQDQGPQGAQSSHRRAGEGEGGQDRALHGEPQSQKGGLIGISCQLLRDSIFWNKYSRNLAGSAFSCASFPKWCFNAGIYYGG